MNYINDIISLQKDKMNLLKKNHTEFCKQLIKINLNPQHLENLGLQLQLTDNCIQELNDMFIEIIDGLKIERCEISEEIAEKIEALEKVKKDIQKATPFLLYLQMNNYFDPVD